MVRVENIGLQSSGKISGALDSKKAHSYIEIGRTGNLHRNRQNRKSRPCQQLFIREKHITKKIGSRDPEDAYQNIQRLWTQVSQKNGALAHTKPWVQSPAMHELSKGTCQLSQHQKVQTEESEVQVYLQLHNDLSCMRPYLKINKQAK